MFQRLSCCSLALLLTGLSASGLQAQTLDQECDPFPPTYSYLLVPERDSSTAAGNELYQNFVPSKTPLVRVDVRAFAGGSPTFRVRILDPLLDFTQNELGRVTTTTVSSGWVVASFAEPIDVIPGITYTIALSWTGPGVGLLWQGADANPYPNAGPDPFDLIPGDKLPDVDWSFRTYSP